MCSSDLRIRDATGIAPDRLMAVPPHTVPKTTSGKVRRGELRRMIEAGEVRDIEAELEGELAAVGASAEIGGENS